MFRDIGNWNSGNVATMQSLFNGTGIFHQDLSGWNVGNINSCPDKPFELDRGTDFGFRHARIGLPVNELKKVAFKFSQAFYLRLCVSLY
ncbi:MAG: BspA family leucine-rich repeat surface protein [Bacteroidetes bacterium]|jgi:hypothetical protein|nr:BspA family leucine-rich repeat surface protein [Bacteroidota bacterium]